jgi:hypothetical protein
MVTEFCQFGVGARLILDFVPSRQHAIRNPDQSEFLTVRTFFQRADRGRA